MLNAKGPLCDLCRARTECFFAPLKGDAGTRFRDNRVTHAYRKRQVVYYEGSQPHGVWIVCSGRVKVFKSDGKGHQLTVRVAGAGQLLGYESLLAGAPHGTSAEALEDAVVAHVDEQAFRALLAGSPELAQRLFGRLARDVRAAEDKALDIATKSSRERLAGELLSVRSAQARNGAAPATMRLPYTRQDLAELAGLAQETVIRLLAEFEERKVIAVAGRQLTVVDAPALERMAGTPN